jgi:hypothetical protein
VLRTPYACDPTSVIRFLGGIQPLVTPAAALFFLIGSIVAVRSRLALLLPCIVGLVIVSPRVAHGNPKWLIVAVPAFAAVSLVGLRTVWNYDRGRVWIRVSACGLLILPWVVGIRASYGDQAWGPGFEMLPFGHPPGTRWMMMPHIGAGAAFPTPEGPRPLLGHVWVLLGNGWAKFIGAEAEEREKVIQVALQQHLPILRNAEEAILVCHLARRGFFTLDPANASGQRSFIDERTFHGSNGNSVKIIQYRPTASPLDAKAIAEVIRSAEGPKAVVYGDSSMLRALFLASPLSLHALGPRSAVIDLQMVEKNLPSPFPVVMR